MTAWLFDLGNTRLKCAALVQGDAGAAVGEVFALPHAEHDLAQALAGVLPSGRIEVAHVASVADPALRVALLTALAPRCRRISLARTQPRLAGVRIAYAQPHKLGVDRFLALVAAHASSPAPVLVCGVGTALTLDLVEADGRHVGGRIAPSPTLMREALHARAAQLPEEGGAYEVFAQDTEDALASGCLGSAVALVEQTQREARARCGAEPVLLLHGGGAQALAPHLPSATLRPSLVLEGLALWAADDRGH
ncbi:type III pantothenate kinase [Agrilutibacter solisilvae]|uniref:Type III pantothenate kinase n=1 Tax=Agrilutibacter solisilvae TaxID=2763317 RepID=A0A974Y171_9GAMM|nr:type III pantothenate kinase [Lysobacter solisilvae]QSX79551.1 type III pantothenate kinase [Lysobacter solisilvae]